jgi:hypothetical protein
VNWVEQIVTALVKFLYGLTKENPTARNAETPPEVRRGWDTWLRGRLRNKGGDDRPQG